MIRKDDIDRNLYPILRNIAESFEKLQTGYWRLHDNFRTAPLVDNDFFLRNEPTRRDPARGCIDRNLLGIEFYNRHKEKLRSLRLNWLITGMRIVSLERLREITEIPFSQNVYMHLNTACMFALKKYSGKAGSNETSISLISYLERIKKGSRKFRLLISKRNTCDIAELRVVKTFFELATCDKPESSIIGRLHGLWSLGFLNNRVRCFAFQFFNNSLAVGARVAARYRHTGQLIDQRCAFCLKGGSDNPGREDFRHIFLDYPALRPTLVLYFREHFNRNYDANDAGCWME